MSSPRDAGAPGSSGPAPASTSPTSNKHTPPSEAPRVRNPFERALIHRLHTPICSPGMCKVYKKTRDGTFRWEIEQHCTLMPVDIVACSSQFEPSPDPQLDRIHEEATERYFSQEVVVASPFEQTSKKVKPLMTSSGSSALHSGDDSVKLVRDASAQTVLTLPPNLPPEVEAILQSYSTYTQDQNASVLDASDWWLRRKLQFEEHSESEQTDEETPPAVRHYESHVPLVFSPDLSRNVLSLGMKRTFGTPLNMLPDTKCGRRLAGAEEPGYSPIGQATPATPATPAARWGHAGGSLASGSVSPVGKVMSSDDEKQNFTSPESEEMATCLNCVSSRQDQRPRECYCREQRGRSLLTRSASMKESPAQLRRCSRSGSLAGKRSSSLSSLQRGRSVQRLDFSLDMSVDARSREELFRCHSVLAGSDTSGSPKDKASASTVKPDLNIYKTDFHTEEHHTIDETPIKGKCKTNVLTHSISQIRTSKTVIAFAGSPMNMSLDNSIDDHLPNLEDKKIDFNSIDLELLTGSQFDRTQTARAAESTVSLKRLDSGFNENTTFFGKSSYYESAIKPSELTVTDFKSSCNGSKALKEISNVNWMRVDSGFKDETSSDNVQFYSEGSSKEQPKFCFAEASLQAADKENVFIEDFDNFLVRASTREEAMSISDIFADEMALNCNFSSTPSKNKVRN